MAVVMAACGGAPPTVPTVGPTSTTGPTNTFDQFAVPAVIDEAYLNRVLAEIDRVYGEVVRSTIAERSVTPKAAAALQSLYEGEALQLVRLLTDHDATTGGT